MEDTKITSYVTTISKYAKQSGLSNQQVKTLCEQQCLPSFKTEGGHWRIIINQDSVSIDEYQKVLQENLFLKAKIKNLKAVLESI